MRMILAFFAAAAALMLAQGAAADHWTQGDQQIHCYTAPADDAASTSNGVNMGPAGTTIQLKGIDMKWVQELPIENLYPDTKLVASIIVTLSRAFFEDNQSLLGNFTTTGLGSKLCFDKTNPADGAQSCAVSPRTDQNCCIWHANIHACRVGPGVICEPWVKATNDTSSGEILVTDTPTIFGAPSEPLKFDQGLYLDEGRWYILGHIKMNNFQCAIGVQRTIKPNLRSSNTPALSSDAKDTTILVAVVIGGVLVLALIVAAVIIFVVRRKAKGSSRQSADDEGVRDRKSDNDPRRSSVAILPSPSVLDNSVRASFVAPNSTAGRLSSPFIPMNRTGPDCYVADPHHQQQVVCSAELYPVAQRTHIPPASGHYLSTAIAAASEPYISPPVSPTTYVTAPLTTLPYILADNYPGQHPYQAVSQALPYSQTQAYLQEYSQAQQHQERYAQAQAQEPILTGEVYEMFPTRGTHVPPTEPPGTAIPGPSSPSSLGPSSCASLAIKPSTIATTEQARASSPVECQSQQYLSITNP